MSDQGYTCLAQGCTQCGVWQGDKRIRPAFIIAERYGCRYWTCPMCEGSYGEVAGASKEQLTLAQTVLDLNRGWNAKETETLISERIDLCRRLANAALTANQAAEAAPVAVEAPTDEAIELASALEQQRAYAIVEAVQALEVGGRDAVMPTPFQAGYQTACDEIMHRLKTEKWSLGEIEVPIAVEAPKAVATITLSEGMNGEPGGCLERIEWHNRPGNGKHTLYATPATPPLAGLEIDEKGAK